MSPTNPAVEFAVPSDGELIARIKRKDEDALAFAMERYSPLVFSSALRILRRRPEAQEVTQDVFWVLWRSPDRFDGARGPLVTWLAILSRSRALDLLRRIQAAARNSKSQWECLRNRTGCEGIPPDSRILFEQLLARLPEKQGCALHKIYFEGYAFHELAALDRTPLGTIKGRVRFGLKKLRSEFA